MRSQSVGGSRGVQNVEVPLGPQRQCLQARQVPPACASCVVRERGEAAAWPEAGRATVSVGEMGPGSVLGRESCVQQVQRQRGVLGSPRGRTLGLFIFRRCLLPPLWGRAGSVMQLGEKEADQVPRAPQPCPVNPSGSPELLQLP